MNLVFKSCYTFGCMYSGKSEEALMIYNSLRSQSLDPKVYIGCFRSKDECAKLDHQHLLTTRSLSYSQEGEKVNGKHCNCLEQIDIPLDGHLIVDETQFISIKAGDLLWFLKKVAQRRASVYLFGLDTSYTGSEFNFHSQAIAVPEDVGLEKSHKKGECSHCIVNPSTRSWRTSTNGRVPQGILINGVSNILLESEDCIYVPLCLDCFMLAKFCSTARACKTAAPMNK